MFLMRSFLIVFLAANTAVTLAQSPSELDKPAPSEPEEKHVPTRHKEPAQEERFDIFEFQVAGNSVLPQLVIEETIYPFLGEKKSFKEVENARQALEKAYHDAGYLTVLVDIPEQEVNAGNVRLQVVEAPVERLKVSGSRYYSLGHIKSKAAELAEGNVPHFPTLQKQLAEVNRGADRRVTPVLRPGRSPGKVEAELKVADKLPLHGNLELNNRYSANTTHSRLSGSVRYDNLWQRDHNVSFQFQVAPEDLNESKVFSANYVLPLSKGNALALYAVRSDSDTGALGDVTVIGNGNIYGLRYIHPLRSKAEGLFHSLTTGVDYKSFDETVQLLGADGFDTPISYTPFTIGYDATWQGEQRQLQFGAAINFSVRGLGNKEREFADKRFNAKASYAYLRLDLKHTEKLAGGWSLFSRVSAQLAGSPLISNEQFAIGGADSVRGYLETEVLGDRGLLGGLELRTPTLWPGESRIPGQAYLIGFVEGAVVEVLDALPGQRTRSSLASSGLGLRWRGRGFSLNMDLALPFKATNNTQARDPRVHAELSYEF